MALYRPGYDWWYIMVALPPGLTRLTNLMAFNAQPVQCRHPPHDDWHSSSYTRTSGCCS